MGKVATLEDIRKAQIAKAALKKFSELGICNTTLDDIAKESGISKGGMAYYYSSKDSLVKGVFQTFFDGIFQRSKETMASLQCPMDKLLSFGWLYDGGDPDVNTGYPLLFDFTSMAVRDEECRHIYHQWVNNWVSLLEGAIVQGNEQGRFRNVDPEPAARLISSLYHGIAMRWYLDRGTHSTEWAVQSFTKAITALMEGNASK
ncbi:MAG: TetR/AcrR family transcriptional regulator [Syntrophobacterales bacterium]|nr:TetR/AcrR family transcriptional regulator [Syntrophobacterales bacterium]